MPTTEPYIYADPSRQVVALQGERTIGLMTVAELARRAQEPAHVIRYYTRIGLLRPGRRLGNGYKLFNGADLQRLRFIRRAQDLGFTLGEIDEMFREAAAGHSPCARTRAILRERIAQNRRRLAEMQALQARMEAALEDWRERPDGIPDGHTVCALIEAEIGDYGDSKTRVKGA